MIINLIQTNKELFSAQFVINRGKEELGMALLQGKLGSMEAVIAGRFNGMEFEMSFGRNRDSENRVFRPYILKQEGLEVGSIYQTKYNSGLFKKFDFHQMIKDGLTYDLFSIGFGEEGSKCPIYHKAEQIAQVEKDCIVYNEMHNYRVFAVDENAGMISVLFCLYMYVNACYKPGERKIESISKTFSVTTNKLLKEKYNPFFKDSICE